MNRALGRNLGTYGPQTNNQPRKDKASAEAGRQRIVDRRNSSARNARVRVLEVDIGAERPVVAMKLAINQQSKGARYPVLQIGQLKRMSH